MIEAQTSCRRIPIPRLPSAAEASRRIRRSQGARYHPGSSLKKTACGACGRVHRGGYDRTIRQARVQRRHAHLTRIRGAASRLPKLWSSEARAGVRLLPKTANRLPPALVHRRRTSSRGWFRVGIPYAFDDYMSLHDPVLERALELAGKGVPKKVAISPRKNGSETLSLK